jgi:Rrf2 family protein
MLSRSAEYAIVALTYLAQQRGGRLCPAEEISIETGIFLPYLWKILRALTDSRMIRSGNGAEGGYRLARAPERIPLKEIVATVSEDRPFDGCILRNTACDARHPCCLHKQWDQFRKRVEKTTLADLDVR